MLALNAASANGVSFTDVDAGAGAVSVTLTSSLGTLAVVASGSVVVTGNASANVQVTGTHADVTATLDDLTFTAPGAPGLATISIAVDDQGNTGTGGALIDTGNFAINVTPLPAITVPGATMSFTAAMGSPSAAQSYAVIGANLVSGIAVSATAPFEIATAVGGPFGAGLNLPAAGGTVFVRYRPTTGLTHNGSIAHVNGDVSPSPAVNLSGQIFRITSAATLPEANVGIAYSGALTVSGGVAPFNWTIMSGPVWLTITPNGVLGGTPVVSDAGDDTVTVLVTDSQNPQQSVTSVFDITVNAPPAPPPVQTPEQASSACSASPRGMATVAVLAILAVLALRCGRERNVRAMRR